jgi:hypothetical protein
MSNFTSVCNSESLVEICEPRVTMGIREDVVGLMIDNIAAPCLA